MNGIGSASGIGAPLPPNRVGGDNFIRYISDRLILDFHEGAGTTVRDLSGNGNNGTFKASGEPAWEKGRVNFDGTDDYIDCGNNASLDVYEIITITANIYPESRDQYRSVITKSSGGSADGGWAFRIKSTGVFEAFFPDGTTPSPIFLTTATISLNEWLAVAATNNGTTLTESIKIYFDSTSQAGVESNYGTKSASNVLNVRIGTTSTGGVAFDGPISFIRMNASVFSALQVLAEYLWNKWRN